MILGDPHGTSVHDSFPRASGDDPERGTQVANPANVSPAQAGMIPAAFREAASEECFPRASGDDPVPSAGTFPRNGFPPRKRG